MRFFFFGKEARSMKQLQILEEEARGFGKEQKDK
jgi:hypothetical protein